MLCKRTSKNQLTIPKAIADQFPDVCYFDAVLEGGRIVLRPVRIDAPDNPDLESIRTKMECAGHHREGHRCRDQVCQTPREAMRVVLDTNVFVSALLFRGPAAAVHSAWTAERFVPLISRSVLDEYTRVLAYPKFSLTEEEVSRLIRNELLRWAEPVNVTSRVAAVRNDPADNRFLELAIDGRADLVVSGDAHLLELGAWEGIPILPVRRFLGSLR